MSREPTALIGPSKRVHRHLFVEINEGVSYDADGAVRFRCALGVAVVAGEDQVRVVARSRELADTALHLSGDQARELAAALVAAADQLDRAESEGGAQ